MITNMNSLTDISAKAGAQARLSYADVQRLQRDVFADGISSREDVERLIDLDRRVQKADPSWSRWLVASIVDYVVWGERPTGLVEEETARWLAAALASPGSAASAKTARLIARRIAEEAHAFENDALVALSGLAATSYSVRPVSPAQGAGAASLAA